MAFNYEVDLCWFSDMAFNYEVDLCWFSDMAFNYEVDLCWFSDKVFNYDADLCWFSDRIFNYEVDLCWFSYKWATLITCVHVASGTHRSRTGLQVSSRGSCTRCCRRWCCLAGTSPQARWPGSLDPSCYFARTHRTISSQSRVRTRRRTDTQKRPTCQRR